MVRLLKRANKEYLFLGIFIALLIFLDIFDRHEPGLQWHKVVYKLNYIVAALVVNYFLLPRYFYTKKYGAFTFGFLIVLVAVIFVDEFFVEWLFYRNSARYENVLFLMTLIKSLPTILLMIGFKFAWDANQKQRKIDTLNRMIAESELQFLNSQINPHFLFNNLNNLYAFALENSPKTPEIILQLSSILRYMLYDCRDKTVLLSKELDNLNDYVKLSELQLDDEGRVTFNIDGEPGNLRIAPLILMVFVENAFKHATASQLSNVQINISVKIVDNTLSFNCENNYSGQTNTDNLSKGIGLKNVKGRLGLSYPDRYKLTIEAKKNWYKVFLEIDLSDD
ncbi:GHKL domain-containing protein [Tangfeifania diversioriginum]|uniref:GHKL domain-containing protein n=1 Tax=Tangfeifania diversioriginum TaxID=1168035 RepID=A0A1M6E8Y7_9BACT|nr:histidine kinase [Tangfeifania diversioriginum]SHI81994.1 GHKL domain-containing protein [Tangfeifania diversioriginum]